MALSPSYLNSLSPRSRALIVDDSFHAALSATHAGAEAGAHATAAAASVHASAAAASSVTAASAAAGARAAAAAAATAFLHSRLRTPFWFLLVLPHVLSLV
eukprot:Rhum_TRINITY_DN14881_c8_g1::Rhum_TRINITY_DN14881_c8_g1_i13::g.125214::m.125214